jgi:protein-S-isoprenylcysteine O-methyltransferase Ste14
MSVERGGSPLRLLMLVPVPWVFVLAYLAGVGLEFAVPLLLPINAPGWTWTAGLTLFALGAAIAGWSLALFYRSRTTTVPGEWSRTLVTFGPYRFTRNPMYVGLTLAYLGEAGLLRQIWPVVLLPLVLAYLNWIVIPVEEARLHEAFPTAYDRYRATVRRWL